MTSTRQRVLLWPPTELVKHGWCTLQVFAPTFPGYGRSEKPAVSYSAELWRDFLRDFVLEVVNRPVVLAGNSIGGYIGASLAADYPDLVAGAQWSPWSHYARSLVIFTEAECAVCTFGAGCRCVSNGKQESARVLCQRKPMHPDGYWASNQSGSSATPRSSAQFFNEHRPVGLAADILMLTPTPGLVLLNSAGKIEPDYQPPKDSSPAAPKAPPPRFVVEVPMHDASPTKNWIRLSVSCSFC